MLSSYMWSVFDERRVRRFDRVLLLGRGTWWFGRGLPGQRWEPVWWREHTGRVDL